MAGVKQSAIARLESMKSTPQIDTLFKILKPLGYTLTIVSDNQKAYYNLSSEPPAKISEGD